MDGTRYMVVLALEFLLWLLLVSRLKNPIRLYSLITLCHLLFLVRTSAYGDTISFLFSVPPFRKYPFSAPFFSLLSACSLFAHPFFYHSSFCLLSYNPSHPFHLHPICLPSY